MTDRPTGPATAAGTTDSWLSVWGESELVTFTKQLFRDVRMAIEAEQKARIFAALPAALATLRCEHGLWQMSSSPEEAAAAVVAAIETQLSREPGEEG